MLDSLHIKNFRCFEDLIIPSLGRVNLIVGKNNSGKSTFLDAIYMYAASGNATIMHYILGSRNELPYIDTTIPPIQYYILNNEFTKEKEIFDSLRNIFNINAIKKSNEKLIIKGCDNRRCQTISLEYSTNKNDIENIQSSNAVQFSNSYVNITEGFIISRHINDNLTDRNIITPFSVVNDIKKITKQLPWLNACYKVVSTLEPENNWSTLWDNLKATRKTDAIISMIKITNPLIEDIYFTHNGLAMVVLADEERARPLRSMGEGASRLLQLFIYAFHARDGFLLIDEFENGLHYSIQEEVWDKLFKLAKELDIQVFATTHSEDAVKAFCKVSVADKEVNGKLISLGRSISKSDNGKIIADVYDEDTLNWLTTSGMEVR
ncbi:AAA family ATPase [Thiothrix subterranea]|uniref:AAA family ATPase n=1 Tax=Thiothrix subterranea TaxID=2735563 RepID=UPI00192C4F88|nr:ATP-binding protein [Thiothrix subterranea]QQZ30612.1 AAA family ATPase [Thiothrix subterranea]